jgi:hypothetical protein
VWERIEVSVEDRNLKPGMGNREGCSEWRVGIVGLSSGGEGLYRHTTSLKYHHSALTGDVNKLLVEEHESTVFEYKIQTAQSVYS